VNVTAAQVEGFERAVVRQALLENQTALVSHELMHGIDRMMRGHHVNTRSFSARSNEMSRNDYS
jgi:hypothetical protein